MTDNQALEVFMQMLKSGFLLGLFFILADTVRKVIKYPKKGRGY